MAFYGLADTSVLGVELQASDNTSLLLRDSDNHHPLAIAVDAVVNDLAALSKVDMLVFQYLERGITQSEQMVGIRTFRLALRLKTSTGKAWEESKISQW